MMCVKKHKERRSNQPIELAEALKILSLFGTFSVQVPDKT
jgi:hypothetical protein